jgi:chemotaxis protein CheX
VRPAEHLNLTASADSAPETWQPLLQLASQEVFEVMLGCRLELQDPPGTAPFELTAMVGLAGQLCARFTLRASTHSAILIASKMLRVQMIPDDALIWDAMGEIANMIAGNFKNKLVGLEDRCMLSLPTVITGSDYKCGAMKNSRLLKAALLFEGAPIAVALEIHG